MRQFGNLKMIFAICLFSFVVKANASIGVIKDIDGYVNVRKEANKSSEIIYQLDDGEVFYYNDSETEWVKVWIQKNRFGLGQSYSSEQFTGYIHHSRILDLESLEIVIDDEISIKYELQEFDANNKILEFEHDFLATINDRHPFGVDGNIPKIEVKSVDIYINDNKYEIHPVFFEDLFQLDNLLEPNIYKNKDYYIITRWYSDGAGAYELYWVINTNGQLLCRYIFIP